MEIPCANKAHRLKTYQKVINEGFKWNLVRVTPSGRKIYEMKIGAVTKAAEAAREEMEPSRGGVTIGDRHITIVFPGFSKSDGDKSIQPSREAIPIPSRTEPL